MSRSRTRDVRTIQLDKEVDSDLVDWVPPQLEFAKTPADSLLQRYVNDDVDIIDVRSKCTRRIVLTDDLLRFQPVKPGQKFVDLGPVFQTSWGMSEFSTIRRITVTHSYPDKPWGYSYLTIFFGTDKQYQHSMHFAKPEEADRYRLAFTTFCNSVADIANKVTTGLVDVDFSASEVQLLRQAPPQPQSPPLFRASGTVTGRSSSMRPPMSTSPSQAWGLRANDSE